MPTPYDTTQPLPGTQQTGNQPTAAAPAVNTSSTVGNVPITLSPQPAGMPQPQQNATPTGIMAPTAAPAGPAASFAPQSSVTAVGPVTQGVASNATVAGQMTDLLANESPYMKQARDYANRDMNARGLMNSSMAVGSSQEAAIKSALPIASQDASTHFNQAQTNQNWLNKFTEDDNSHLRNLDTIGANTRGSSALSSQGATQDIERINAQAKAETDRVSASLSADMRKQYLDQSTKLRDQFSQDYSNIQMSSMADAQKSAAITELGVRFKANTDWVDAAYANMSINAIDMAAFMSMKPTGGSQAPGGTTTPGGTTPPGGTAPPSGSTTTTQQNGNTVVPPNMVNPITGQNGGTVPASTDGGYWKSAAPNLQSWNLINNFSYPQAFLDQAASKGVPLYNSQGQRLVDIAQSMSTPTYRGGTSRPVFTGRYSF